MKQLIELVVFEMLGLLRWKFSSGILGEKAKDRFAPDMQVLVFLEVDAISLGLQCLLYFVFDLARIAYGSYISVRK